MCEIKKFLFSFLILAVPAGNVVQPQDLRCSSRAPSPFSGEIGDCQCCWDWDWDWDNNVVAVGTGMYLMMKKGMFEVLVPNMTHDWLFFMEQRQRERGACVYDTVVLFFGFHQPPRSGKWVGA